MKRLNRILAGLLSLLMLAGDVLPAFAVDGAEDETGKAVYTAEEDPAEDGETAAGAEAVPADYAAEDDKTDAGEADDDAATGDYEEGAEDGSVSGAAAQVGDGDEGSKDESAAADTPAEVGGADSDGEEEEFEFVPGYILSDVEIDPPVIDEAVSFQDIESGIYTDRPYATTTTATTEANRATAGDAAFPYSHNGAWLNYFKNNYPATRDQNPWGTCWAHSAVGLAEFYMVSHGLASKDNIDYSELHLVYWDYNQGSSSVAGDTGDKVSNIGMKNILDGGGNLLFAAHTWMRERGVAAESVAPYSLVSEDNGSTTSWKGLDKSTEFMDSAYLENAQYIDIDSRPDLVKNYIIKNGAVGASIYADSSFYDRENNSYYCPYEYTTNHAVMLVGWDDNYPASGFLSDPGDDGAWLVRNSWTTSAAASYYSYFWISYYDEALNGAWVFDFRTDKGYDNNYFYDSQMHIPGYCNADYVANVYTAAGAAGAEKESIEAVGFELSAAAGSRETEFLISIYKNVTGSSNPLSGTHVKEADTSVKVYTYGFYTVPLTVPVEVERGTKYSVVIRRKSGDYAIAFEYPLSGWGFVSSKVGASAGQSFKSSTGSSWYDWGKNEKENFVITALTNDVAVEHVEITSESSVSDNGTDKLLDHIFYGEGEGYKLEAVYYGEAGRPDESAVLSWESSDESVVTVDANGWLTAVGEGQARVGVSYLEYYDSVVVTVRFIPTLQLNMNVSELSLRGGESYQLKATVVPSNAKNKSVSYESSDPSVAEVDENGLITAAILQETMQEKAKIYARQGELCAECVVTVRGSDALAEDLEQRAATESNGFWLSYDFIDDGDAYDPFFAYTGEAVRPNVRVFYEEKRLVKGVDYKVSFKNNVAAADKKLVPESKAPTVIVTFMGNYKGVLKAYFSISKKDLSDEDVRVADAYGIYNGKAQKLKPAIYWNGKALPAKEYRLVTTDGGTAPASYTEPGVYELKFVPKGDAGNFKGEAAAKVIILDKSWKSMVNLAKTRPVMRQEDKAGLVYDDGADAKEPVYDIKGLNYGVDYEIEYEDNYNIGTARAYIVPKEGSESCYGMKLLSFRISKPAPVDLSKIGVEVNVYNELDEPAGSACVDESGVQTDSGFEDYGGKFSVVYARGGAKPKITVETDGWELTEGRDYKLSYKDNKTAGKAATVIISGMGRYKGKKYVVYDVVKQDLSKLSLSLTDVPAVNRKYAYQKTKISLKDLDGKALRAGTDFVAVKTGVEASHEKYYDEEERKCIFLTGNGRAVQDAGSTITLTLKAKEGGNYTGYISAEYHVYDSSCGLSRAKISINEKSLEKLVFDPEEPVVLTKDDITVMLGKNTLYNEYEIESITGNAAAGKKGRLTIRGTGQYGGTKTLSFTIKQRVK